MKVRAVHHILSVADMARATRFYQHTLGFEVIETPGPAWTNLSCGNGQIALNAWNGTTEPKETSLSLVVDDLDAACQAVTSGGGTLIRQHEPHAGSNVRLAEVSDTEGNKFLLAMHVR